MIVTLTPNPSLDRTLTLDIPLEPGAVHRVVATKTQAAGKGVNVSRAAHLAGVPTLAVLPVATTDPLLAELLADGIRVHAEPIPHAARTNLTITGADGTTTKINEPGTGYSEQVRDGLVQALLDQADIADWYVLSGSLPPGCPAGWYAEIVTSLRARGARVAVDTSDGPLAALIDALPAAAPNLMKPNSAELAAVVGSTAAELDADPVAAAEAAASLIDRGVETVIVSLGAHGAVLANRDGAWHAAPPPTLVASTVGAGDSALFGYLYAAHLGHDDPSVRLAYAVAYGSAAASLPGTTVPDPHHIKPKAVETVRLPNTRKVTR